jgi:hypothetical protein
MPNSPVADDAWKRSPGAILSADISELKEPSIEQLLLDINTRSKKFAWAPVVGAIAAILVILLFGQAPGASIVLAVVGAGLAWKLNRNDSIRRSTALFYEFDDEQEARWSQIQQALRSLGSCSNLWRVHTSVGNSDWKRNAGAGQIVTRRGISFMRHSPPFLATNIDVVGVDVGDSKLYFLPDLLLVWGNGKYGAVTYGSLSFKDDLTIFIEDGPVPRDAEVVGHTWQYVNKSGGPDRRFKNNRQLPKAKYGNLHITSSTGLNLVIETSKWAAASEVAGIFRQLRHPSFSESRSGREANSAQFVAEDMAAAWETLGLKPGASDEEISSAYRNLAKMYHPDRVSGMAPEFREVAERRMKEINAAHELLSKSKVA